MSDSKFDGIEDLTEVKYDPADPYKHRRKKIPCKFCPKFISSRNMSTHVKTVHADVDDNQIHSIKNSTRCSKKLVCIKSEENAKELKIDLKEHIFGVHRILSNAKQRQKVWKVTTGLQFGLRFMLTSEHFNFRAIFRLQKSRAILPCIFGISICVCTDMLYVLKYQLVSVLVCIVHWHPMFL